MAPSPQMVENPHGKHPWMLTALSRVKNEGKHRDLPAPTCSACWKGDVGQQDTHFPCASVSSVTPC